MEQIEGLSLAEGPFYLCGQRKRKGKFRLYRGIKRQFTVKSLESREHSIEMLVCWKI